MIQIKLSVAQDVRKINQIIVIIPISFFNEPLSNSSASLPQIY